MTTRSLIGVNLGGWLLLERWMTPSLFEGTDAPDEFTFMQRPDAARRVDAHRKTYITEEDFQWLQAHSITAVRIPVGYWALQDEPPFISAQPYLDWAMEMAKKYSIQVIIDLHGLKGSQNGRDHSGQIGLKNWLKRTEYRQDTLDTLEVIARRYRDNPMFWGLQIINEPDAAVFHFTLRKFYKQAYDRLAEVLEPHTRIIFSDAFTPRLLTGALRGREHPVVMDVHLYHMTTLWSQFLSIGWFLKKTQRRERLLARLAKTQPIIIGEWSGVMRGEVVGRLSLQQQDKLFRLVVQLQQEVYSVTAGHFYWSYKTELPGQWNFRSEVEAGRIGRT